jgi:hypothetical protein
MTLVWGTLMAAALLWPGRLAGPLDGVPLDRAADALLIGLLFPALCWLDPAFLNRRAARVLIVALLGWKAVTALTVTQDGWCVGIVPSRPYVRDQAGLPHSWDVRADWRSANPRCSAVMTRPYAQMDEFPVWFFNLPGPNGDLPQPADIPPRAATRMIIDGVLAADRPGALQIAASPSVAIASVAVDGRPTSFDGGSIGVEAGSHRLSIDTTITENLWTFAILHDGANVFDGRAIATISPPSRLDRLVRPWGRWIPVLLGGTLLLAWLLSATWHVLDAWALAWLVTSSGTMGVVAAYAPERRWQWAVLALTAASLLPLARRLRNARGAFLLIGVPWLVFVAVATKYDIGRMTFYEAGNDAWQFQRYAYRVFLQGYWLEGGETTFWFQPLYRWIAGALHLLFGDSSLGEEYWNGACLTVMALFGFEVTRIFAGVRWGLAAAAFTLALFVAGPGFVFVQNGLSEISSAGFIYLGALCALESRRGSFRFAVAAGVCAVLGFYTRLNNAPMAVAIALFAWPVDEPIATLFKPRAWFDRAARPTVTVVLLSLAAGLVLFAWRTYHYTGVFSVTKGTALDPSRSHARMLWANTRSVGGWLGAMFDSVMMVLTTTDPPRVHHGSIPLLAAAVISIAAAAGFGPFATLPLSVVLFTLSALAGSLVARGTAYPGRFSIHILGAAATVCVCLVARLATKAASLISG